MPAISCVIVAFHRPDSLERLLGMLADGDLEVVVVNVDDDPEIALVAAHVTCVPLPGNPGYAAAVNVGVAAASGAAIVFCNDDLVADAATFTRLATRALDRDAVVVPALASLGGGVEPSAPALPTVGRLLVEWALLPDWPIRGLARIAPI